MIISLVLFIFSLVSGVCSNFSAGSECEGADCFWVSGLCKAVDNNDCLLSKDCPAGCAYTASKPMFCVDETAETCAASVECTDTSKCEMTDGTCVLSETAPLCEGVDPNLCSDGCVVEGPTKACVPEQITLTGCSSKDITFLTECTYNKSCEWVSGKCQVKNPSENQENWCEEFTNSFISPCTRTGQCKVSNNACVYDSEDNSYELMCSDININDFITECEEGSKDDCQINDANVCMGRDGWENENCTIYSTSRILVCSLEVTQVCSIQSGLCKFDSTLIEDYCSGFSTVPITECTRESHDYCNFELEGYCTEKTESEICSMQSVVNRSQCELEGECKIENGFCVNQNEYSEVDCSSFSIEKTISDCTRLDVVRCGTDSVGACVPRVPVCNMNSAGSGCDSSNLPNDKCQDVVQYTCNNVDCSVIDKADCAGTEGVNNTNAGCVWNSDMKACVTKNPLICSVQVDETCSDSGCKRIPAVDESCTVGTVTDNICNENKEANGCGAYAGCKWVATEGTCVEKNCSNSASYAHCCITDASCQYCAADPRPSDCPNSCEDTPSYANCCTDESCEYCAKFQFPKPDDCPISSASIMFTPVLLLIAALFMGLY